MDVHTHSPPDTGITVIVMTHGRPHELREALRSLVEQSHQSFDVIVCDDAGPESGANLDAVRSCSMPLTYLRLSRNSGPAIGRNTAATLARTSHLAFLDDDDLFLSNAIESRLKRIHEGHDLIVQGYVLQGDPWVADKNDPGKLTHLDQCDPWCGRFTIAKSLFEKAGGFPNTFGEDSELYRRAARLVTPFIDPQPSLVYRRMTSQLSRSASQSFLCGHSSVGRAQPCQG